MKTIFRLLTALTLAALISCSKDDDAIPGSKLEHVGQKWTITSVNYTIVDQSLSNPANWIQTGTASNAGAFYLNGSEGSFDILINKNRQEDYFGYSMDNSAITIVQIDQSVSTAKFSQSIIAFNGEQSSSSMTLNGTFTRQSTSGQYVFTGDFVLTKE
jgi:hypothetical protein